MNKFKDKYFTSLAFSTDGDFLLGGGKTKYVCLYELRHRILLKKFLLSDNRSLDNTLEFLNSKQQVKAQNSDSEPENVNDYLPGSKYSLISKRKIKPSVETRELKFSPAEDSFIVATTEGLMIFK